MQNISQGLVSQFQLSYRGWEPMMTWTCPMTGLLAQEEEWDQWRVTLEILFWRYDATLSPINPVVFATAHGSFVKTATLRFDMWQELNYSIFTLFKLWLNKCQSWLIPFPTCAIHYHCSWTRMLQHNSIIVLENFVIIWANVLQRESFSAGCY